MNYLELKRFLPRFLERKLTERFWAAYWRKEQARQVRDLGERAAPSLLGSERAVLVEAILEHAPFESLLEVGCSYGQLFHIIAPFLPNTCLCGIDPDIERVEAGRAHLSPTLESHVQLQVGAAEALTFPEKSFDLVVTSASLLYVPPENIRIARDELLRVGRRFVLLLEQHRPEFDALGTMQAGVNTEPAFWLRNYLELFAEVCDRRAIRVLPVPKPIWTSECWQKHATLIEVRL